MGQIIASGNLKGGTGKTTIAVNLASALAERGLAVSLLDVDPQASAGAWAESGLLPIRVETAPPVTPTGGGRWLGRAVELAAAADVLLVDLPPLLVAPTASAIMVADLILVPVTASALDVAPTEQVLRMIRMSRESRRDGSPKALLVPSRGDPAAAGHDATGTAIASLHERWAPPVSQHADHVTACALGTWTGRYAPASEASKDLGALADLVEAMLGLVPRPRPVATAPAGRGDRRVPA